jgi:arylsulfatase
MALVELLIVDGGATKQGCLRQGRFKLIETAGAPPELYDMAEDRGETTNLAERFPDRVQAMQRLLEQLGP